MTIPSEGEPPKVLKSAKQGGVVPPVPNGWANRTVWTERMLTALETGLKGGKWFSLIDKVFSERTLEAAANNVVSNKGASGVDHVSVEAFQERLEENVKELARSLRTGSYQPSSIRRVMIPKPGSQEKRPLGIPTVRDRVVQTAICYVIEPIFDKEFAEHSYGFRPGKGCKDALREVDRLLRTGMHYVVDADLKSYFDTIPHERLMERMRSRIADERLLQLIESYLKVGILVGDEEIEPEAGAPQGAVLSPLLSNIYLNPLDHQMAKQGTKMVRYADDFVILCGSKPEAETALEQVRKWCEAEGLQLHPTKTKIVDVREEGFDFLGYRFETSKGKKKLNRFPRKKSLMKLRETLRAKTRRVDGNPLFRIIGEVNQTLRGWYGYFKNSHPQIFGEIDGWIRTRMRRILGKREHRRTNGRWPSDYERYPNAYFGINGYYSLKVAYEMERQSSLR